MAWCMTMTEKVNQITELDVGLWTTVFSPALGTVVWTALAEDLEQLELTDQKLVADSGYLNLVDEGAQFLSADPINDSLIQLIHAPEPAEGPRAEYATVVQSALAPGKTVAGIGIGIEIAQRATTITGAPTSFGAAATGLYGGVVWVTPHESVQALQRANEALAAELSFAEYIDREASDAFVSAVTNQTVYRRIM
jgi:hypothetical protein